MAWVGRRFGKVRTLTVGFILASLVVLLTPILTNSANNSTSAYRLNFTARVIIGLAQGGTYPLLVGLWGKWAPKEELSRLIAIQFAGSGFGTFIILPIITQMTSNLGWEYGFYLVGKCQNFSSISRKQERRTISCIQAWLDYFVEGYYTVSRMIRLLNTLQFQLKNWRSYHQMSSSSLWETHQIGLRSCSLWTFSWTLARRLRNHLKESKGIVRDVPWRQILTSLPLWAIIVAHFSSNYGSYVLQNYLPSYLKEQLHYDFASSGYISSVPNLVKVIITLVAGFVSDFLVYKLELSNPSVRKIMTTIGLAGPALAMFFSG